MVEITIPYKFKPRPYQLPILKYIDWWWLRAVQLWHRRTGKDKTDFNIIIKKAMERVWVYFHIFPTYAQGKKVIWDGIDKAGMKVLDHIPAQLIRRRDWSDLLIELINGSIIQIVWTDGRNIDRLVGTNPAWVVFSEYSLQNPRAWDLVRPILAENWWRAIFNFTPRWENHAYDLYNMAKDNDKWFCQSLTVDQTFDDKGNRVISDELIQEERDSGMDEDLIQQEYYVSFQAFGQWSYYSKQIKQAQEENRITIMPYEPSIDVDTFWDLWVNDINTIWFTQRIGKEVRVIDYMEWNWEWLTYYLWEINKKTYKYGFHYFPHDIRVREYTNGKSREDTLIELWVKNYKIVDKLSVEDGIDAVRRVFQYCVFDREKCKQWILALKDYHKEYDELRKTFKAHPEHNWASNAADSFRYMSVIYIKDLTKPMATNKEGKVRMVTNPLTGQQQSYVRWQENKERWDWWKNKL